MSSDLPLEGTVAKTDVGTSLEHNLAGEVLRVVFTSADESYCVLKLRDAENNEHTVVGSLMGLQEGSDVEATGRWEQHNQYGRQFRVSHFREVLPSNDAGIRRYLASGVIPGIGPKLAERIVDTFGAETFRVLDNFSGRLSEVPGLGRGRVKTIREAWKERSGRREILVYLQGLGISPAYCHRVLDHYGENAASIVGKNPFRLARDIRGIGFKMADNIARNLNIERNNPYRLGAGIVYVVDQLVGQGGHCCVPKELLLERAGSVLGVGEDDVLLGLQRAIDDGAVVVSTEGCETGDAVVYPSNLYNAEIELAQLLQLFRPKRTAAPASQLPLASDGDQWQMLNEAQQRAVVAALQHPLSVITGGPGVGKTTVTREIVACAARSKERTLLAAPTGRAAKRLSDSSGESAQTIHRLLKWDPERRGFVHNQHNPLPVDLLIVDEVSMLDLQLAVSLFRAIPPTARVVLVGDRDQLPSVGPGSILRDLISSEQFPVSHLREVYRQAANSSIIVSAHQVNAGELPHLHSKPGKLKDFYWIEQEETAKVLDLIRRMITERIPERFQLDPRRDVQVLTPMNRGDCGVSKLNKFLQGILNPPNTTQATCKSGENLFSAGDRVLQTVNNYDLGVFNGDLGRIEHIAPERKAVDIRYDTGIVTYSFIEMEQVQLAYATTIHKSQGSEFPAVIVPVLSQHYIMLRRNLIYTAMTRAGRLLVMIGARRALAMAVSNYKVTPRYSYLTARLQATVIGSETVAEP